MKSVAVATIALCTAFLAVAAEAQNANNGAQICAQTGTQYGARIASDGAGGAFITWQDGRTGDWDIYAQHVSSSGVSLWALNGVAVCSSVNTQFYPVIIADGTGGAIIAWQDSRSGGSDIYAQKIGAAGTAQWTFNGVALCTIGNEQQLPAIAPDGAGGAIVTWQDFRNGNSDIYAQRVLSSGTPSWAGDGVIMCNQGSAQQSPVIVSDDAGGAIVVWQDLRSGGWDIYGQRVNASGFAQWFANGLAYSAASGNQEFPVAVPDGAGGAIASWQDTRSGQNAIYTQRLNATGVALWTTDGVALCTISGGAMNPVIARSGSGGAIVAWQDQRNGGSNRDIYAQQISAGGVPQWSGNGVGVCTVGADQLLPSIAADGSDGALIAWYDYRFSNHDIYAQKLSASGALQWPAEGASITSKPSHQYEPVIASDGAGGAVVAWRDDRYSTASDIFGQRLSSGGSLLLPDAEYPRLVSVRDVPNDQGGRVKLSWTASNQDLAPFALISSYWIWRSAPPNMVQGALSKGTRIPRMDDCRAGADPPTLVSTTSMGADYYWEFIASQPVGHIFNYSYVAATTGDSVPGSNPYTAFMIQALGGSQWWYSNPDSGYSVDNLSPPPPTQFLANRTDSQVMLHWAPSMAMDFSSYRLYRGTTLDFVPGQSNLLAAQPDTGYTDPTLNGYYYKLSAVDLHGNEGAYTIASASPTTLDVTWSNAPDAAWLAPAEPNIVSAGTTIRFGIPRSGPVDLSVYDAAGRRVRTLVDEPMPAGEHRARWDGMDGKGHSAAPGLYLYRLGAAGQVLGGRLIVVK